MGKKLQELSWEDFEREVFGKTRREFCLGDKEVQTVLYERVCVGCNERELRIEVTYSPFFSKTRDKVIRGIAIVASYDLGELPLPKKDGSFRNALLSLINNWNENCTIPKLSLVDGGGRMVLRARVVVDFHIVKDELDFAYLRRNLSKDIPERLQEGMGTVMKGALACGLDDESTSGDSSEGAPPQDTGNSPRVGSPVSAALLTRRSFSGRILKGEEINAALVRMACFCSSEAGAVRLEEIKFLLTKLRSSRTRGLLVYGRRRVGKTHFIADLIRIFLENEKERPNSVKYLLILNNAVDMEQSYDLLSAIPDNCLIYATSNWLAHCYMPTLLGEGAEEKDFWSSNLPSGHEETAVRQDTKYIQEESDIHTIVQELIKEILELGRCRFIAELPIEREEDRPALSHVYGQVNDNNASGGNVGTRRNLLSYLNFYTRPQSLLSGLGKLIERHELSEPSSQQLAQILRRYVNRQNQKKKNAYLLSEEGIDLIARISHAYGNGSEPALDRALTLLDILTRLPKDRLWDENDIREAAAALFNVSADKIQTKRSHRIHALREELRNDIIGQEEAINTIVDSLIVSEAGLNERSRPKLSALCVGPSGVGKTELAKSLAKRHFGSEEALIQIDMSAFQNADTVFKLIGFSPSYKGAEMGGQLTGAVWRKPHSVILFDEIEKSHPNVRDLLLQILDEGNLEDGWGLKVSFENCIILITTNVGASLLLRRDVSRGIGFAAGDEEPRLASSLAEENRQFAMKELGHVFRPETLNRFDSVIVFNPLGREQCRAIASLQIGRIFDFLRGRGIFLTADESLVEHLLEIGFDPEKGARPLRRAAAGLLKKPLAIAMDDETIVPGGHYCVAYDEEGNEVLFHPAC